MIVALAAEEPAAKLSEMAQMSLGHLREDREWNSMEKVEVCEKSQKVTEKFVAGGPRLGHKH